MGDLHDLRMGNIVIREMDADGGIERHVGEVLSIHARVKYLDVDYRWGEWWDVSTATLWPFRPEDVPGYRLRRASADEIERLGLR
ncbi:hypothetical protein GGR39_003412 [Novosphingobium fluoreni]|uniref:Uncharacterized protein n=2 Tax=Novosphingobium fluoreni TaxID=1391222 RepID=A0A7W6FZW0_9SPHN|nr:hypothetical protein [Novosphingobium fluoreni]